jgi:hypothetical protein
MNGAPTSQFVVLACDESGSKGYADRDEQTVGEVARGEKVDRGVESRRARHCTILSDFVACRWRMPHQAAESRTWNLLPVAWA